MNETRYPRGSEWRRWDLHVHTPFSALNNGFGNNFDLYAQELFNRAIEKEIAVVGVTDYFVLEGYERLIALQADHDRLVSLIGEDSATKAKNIVLLPNLELRSSHIVEQQRVNFHIIFSNEVPVSTIREHFFAKLRFKLVSDPENRDEERQLTKDNLIELGRRLKSQHKQFASLTDLVCGMQNVIIDHDQALDALKTSDIYFRKRYLFVVPVDEDLSSLSWNGQDHQARKTWYQKCHAYFSANAKTRLFALGHYHESEEHCRAEFGSLKPCFHGSDAHDFDHLFVPNKDRFCWIKADPSFAGLRQTLNEPASRVFIGLRPDELIRVETDPTRYVESVAFHREATLPRDQEWFGSQQIPLNSGLVAIIGNKGGGKNALADVIAHAGRSRQSKHFSFLRKTRFLSLPVSIKSGFIATLKLSSGKELVAPLGSEPDNSAEEIVKYIPQGYLDELCTEIKATGETQFDTELKTVIFSHVPEARRLEADSLDNLIELSISEKERRLLSLRSELAEVTSEIVRISQKLNPTAKREIEEDLKSRNEELDALQRAQPAAVPEPKEDASSQNELSEANAALKIEQKRLSDFLNEIRTLEDEEKKFRLRRLAAQRVRERVENFKREWEACKFDLNDDVNLLDISIQNLIRVDISLGEVVAYESETATRLQNIERELDVDAEGSLAKQAFECRTISEELEAKLDAPNRRYQEYLRANEEWQEKVRSLIGQPDLPDSIEGLKERIRQIVEFWPQSLNTKKEQRVTLVKHIHETLLEIVGVYEEFFKPVQEFIERHPVAAEQGSLNFSAKIALSQSFSEKFLGCLDRSKRGSFQGKEDGERKLKEESQSADFETADGASRFADRIEELLITDEGEAGKPKREIRSQLRTAVTEEDILAYVYGLEYLEARYTLTWQGKSLEQLSPGERGNLLLVFYLLIDKRTCPLIIDQPEENLDNQTIAKMLVPCLKYAKGRRQVFVVTHNPNLAVVADADQIIHAEIDKAGGNKITYTAGSIEEPRINQMAVAFLEGTKPAFDLRDSKYELFY